MDPAFIEAFIFHAEVFERILYPVVFGSAGGNAFVVSLSKGPVCALGADFKAFYVSSRAVGNIR